MATSALSLMLTLPSPTAPSSTLPQWVAWLTITFSVWCYHFVCRMKPDAICKEEERRRDSVLQMMTAVLAYVDAEEAKDKDRKLPEADRVFKLLWDKTHGCSTRKWGITKENEMFARCEALYRRVSLVELRKAIELTRRSRDPGAIREADKEEMKLLTEHESGEKLHKLIRDDKEVRKTLGKSFCVEPALLCEAKELLRLVYRDQSKNSRELFRLVRPVLPHIVFSCLIGMLHTALRSKFHQIGIWVMTIEAGASGDMSTAYAMLFNLWLGHMIIKLIELPEFCYTRRSKVAFGNGIRNGVLGAMVRQDFEFFDRIPAGVLQDRLNRDADELGENLIGFPKDLLNSTVWIVSNLVQVYMATPTTFFMAAISPVALMCIFQYFTFQYFRQCNERARRVEEEGVSATSEVLRQIKTVRQFASEHRAAATYARRNLARQLIGERVTTLKRALEVIVWCIFDSGICLTIILGLPFVLNGQMSAGRLCAGQIEHVDLAHMVLSTATPESFVLQHVCEPPAFDSHLSRIDCFCKLNFNVNFCLRELLEKLPRMARLLEPMGRICDLLQAKPNIEPAAHPAYFDVADAVQLDAVLSACTVKIDEKGLTRLTLARDTGLEAANGKVPAIGAELVCISTTDHRYLTAPELVAELGAVAPVATVPGRLTYPVRAVFSTKRRPPRFQGRIEFDDCHFAYPTDLRKPVLQGLSFTVEPGEKVALVGPTGCGKSSCMSLLQRLYEPSKGQIRLDGVPLAEYDLHNMRSRVVIVDQNTVLFSTSIKENITYGMDRKVSDDEIIEACERAHAWEFINEKPDKLMTELTGGSNLSGGQKQRLAIARAILRKPDVILLDEATSALDNENEAKVQKALDELARGGSSLVIAHRLSTIKDADKIVVVDQGRAVEIGTHDELLKVRSVSTISTCPSSSSISSDLRGVISSPPSESELSCRSHGDDEIAAMVAPQPPSLRRERSSPSTVMSTGPAVKVTYRRLWQAATGDGETTSLSAVMSKIERMTTELDALRAKQSRLSLEKSKLLGELAFDSGQAESVVLELTEVPAAELNGVVPK